MNGRISENHLNWEDELLDKWEEKGSRGENRALKSSESMKMMMKMSKVGKRKRREK